MNKRISLPNKNQPSDKWLYVVLAIVVIVVVGYGVQFLLTHHKTEQTSYTPRPEVLANRYHTALVLLGKGEIFKGEQGHYHVMTGFKDTAHASDDVIMINSISHGDKSHFDEMINWMQQGGHLVVINKSLLIHNKLNQDEYEQAQNPFMTYLGVDYVGYEHSYYENQNSDKRANLSAVPLNMGGELVVLQDDAYAGRFGRFVYDDFLKKYPHAKVMDYRIYDKATHQLLPNINTTLNSTQKTVINELLKASKTVGDEPILFNPDNLIFDVVLDKGRLTLLANDKYFINPHQQPQNIKPSSKADEVADNNHDWALLTDNKQISEHGYYGGIMAGDNGEFLRLLVGERLPIIVPDVVATGFFTLLWRNLTWTLIGIVLTVVVWLLALPKRFGAVKVYQSDSSRNIFGFFAHVGQYLWASDGGEALFAQNRHTLIQSILAKEVISESTETEVAQVVSERTGLSYGMVYEALYGTWTNEQEFIRMSRSFARVSGFYGVGHF